MMYGFQEGKTLFTLKPFYWKGFVEKSVIMTKVFCTLKKYF